MQKVVFVSDIKDQQLALQKGGLFVPVWFVNTMIAAIFASLIGIAGYMVSWNKEDAAFKAGVLLRLTAIERKVDTGFVPRGEAQQRLQSIERRLDKLENHVDKLR